MAKRNTMQNKFKKMYTEYLEKYWVYTVDKYASIPEKDVPRIGGIIRDKIAFYLHSKYEMNYFMTRNYICPDKVSFNAMQKFIEDGIDPHDVSQFQANNREYFKSLSKKKLNISSETMFIFSKQHKSFVCMKQGEVYTTRLKHNATAFGMLFDKGVTEKALYESVCKSFDSTLDMDNYLFMPDGGSIVSYYEMATSK